MGDEQQGLAGAMEQPPDFSASPPQTPEELEQRKGQWRGLLGQIQSDPNIMRAITVMGIRMMQPGATFGQGVAAGFGAYEGGRAAQAEWDRQNAIDAQNAQMKDLQMRGMQQTQGQTAQMFPKDLALKQAEIDRIPDMRQRERAQAQLAELNTRMAEAGAQTKLDTEKQQLENLRRQGSLIGAQTEHQRQLGSQAQKKTAAEVQQEQYDRDMSMYMNVVKKANPAWDDSQVFVEAQRQYNASRYGQPAQMKQQSVEEQARDYYAASPDSGPGTPDWIMMSPQEKILWTKGKQLSTGSGSTSAPNNTGVQKIGPVPIKAVRDENGNIVRAK